MVAVVSSLNLPTMRKVFILLLMIAAIQLQAQKTFKQHSAYAEILGNGGVLSVNYELQLKKKAGFGIHVGIGLGGDKPAIPLGVKYLIAIGGQKSFLETGAGFTLAEREFWVERINRLPYNPYQIAWIPSIGYRHHTNYGLMWKLIYSPFFHKDRKELLFFGAAIGWRF